MKPYAYKQLEAKKEDFNPFVREPKGSNAASSHAWEMALLCRHYHPSVATFACSLLAGVAEGRGDDGNAGAC